MITAEEAKKRADLANDDEMEFIESKASEFFLKDVKFIENKILLRCGEGFKTAYVYIGKGAYKRKLGPYINHQILKKRASNLSEYLNSLGYYCFVPEFQVDSNMSGIEIAVYWN